MVQWFVSGLPRIAGFPVLAIPAAAVFVLFLASLCVHRWYAGHLDRFRESPSYAIAQLAHRTRDFGVSYGELVFGRLLGKGSQGEVFEASWRGLPVAVKRVDTRTVASDIIDEFVAEADIMRRLRHPAITLFMGLSLETNSLCIVTELVSRGSLFDILQDAELSGITWKRALQIAVDIASGMTYLHGHNPPILHRDLKSLNILVTSLWRGKVADFGMTRFQQDPTEEKSMTQCLEASTRILLADGSVRAISDPAVKVGALLAGEQGPVRVVSKFDATSAEMYVITHADGFSYTVTPNHLVTLRWAAGPATLVHTALDGRRIVEMTWWEFDGTSFQRRARSSQRHFRASDDLSAADDDHLRSQARSAWDQSRLAGGEGSMALFAGDLIDIPAEALADPDVWNMLFPVAGQHLATSRRINLIGSKQLSPGVELAEIKLKKQTAHIVIMAVDGDNRFALEDGTITHNCGSPLWMSPEMIKNESYDGKADVYSFSIVLWELYTRRVPYRALNLSPSQLVVKVVRDGLRPDIPKDCPRKLTKLLQACWHRDAAQRPSFAAILKTLEGFLADKAMLRHKPGEKKSKSKGAAAAAAAGAGEADDDEDGGDDSTDGGAPTDELQSAFELLVASTAGAGDKAGDGSGWLVDPAEVEVSNVRLLSEVEQQALGTADTSVVEDGAVQPLLLLHTITLQHPLSPPVATAAPIVGLSPSVSAVVASSAASSRASSRLGMTQKLRSHRVYRGQFRGRGVIVKKCTLSDSARTLAAAAPTAPSGRMAPASSTVQLSSFGSCGSDGDVSIPADLTNEIDHRALHALLARAAALRHPNIVLLMASYVSFDHVGIVEEDVARGSLARILADSSVVIEWDQSLQFLIDAASALNYLALSGGGVHPDLRTSRLLVTANWRVKLSGCAFTNLDRKLALLAREQTGGGTKKTPPSEPVHQHSGSLSTLQQQDSTASPLPEEADVSFWTAPELFDQDDPLRTLSSSDPAASSGARGPTLASSVYSFSLIMWHVCLRSLPYAGKFGSKLRAKIKDGLRLPIPSSLSPKFRALIKACWAPDPQARPSFAAILAALQQIKRDGPPRIVLDATNSLLYRKAATVFAHASKDELTVLKDWGRNRGQKGDMVIAASSCSDLADASAALPAAGPALAAFHATFTEIYLCDSRVFGSSYEPTGRFPHEYRKVGMVRAKRMNEAFAIRTGGGSESTVDRATAAAASASAAASSSLYPSPAFPPVPPLADSPSLLIVEQGVAGDYIVQNDRGDQWCVEGKVMESSYVVVEEPGSSGAAASAAAGPVIDAAASSAASSSSSPPPDSKLARPSISVCAPAPSSTSSSAPAAAAAAAVQLVGLGGGQLTQASPSASLAPPKPAARSGHKTSGSKQASTKRVADSSAQ